MEHKYTKYISFGHMYVFNLNGVHLGVALWRARNGVSVEDGVPARAGGCLTTLYQAVRHPLEISKCSVAVKIKIGQCSPTEPWVGERRLVFGSGPVDGH